MYIFNEFNFSLQIDELDDCLAVESAVQQDYNGYKAVITTWSHYLLSAAILVLLIVLLAGIVSSII